jgi:DNA-directed RNA polymerase subunit beta
MRKKDYNITVFWDDDRPIFQNIPDLLKIQYDSFNWFLKDGLREVLGEISPIESTRQGLSLEFVTTEDGIRIDPPQKSPDECLEKGLTYESSIYVRARLYFKDENKNIKDVKEQIVFLGNIPQMTERATFIVNGTEKVIVNQITRSPGVFFQEEGHSIIATLIPTRGGWKEK